LGPVLQKNRNFARKARDLRHWLLLVSGKVINVKVKRYPDFETVGHEGGKVVSPKHRPPFSLRKYSWYLFLLRAKSTPEP
jgi:hypothetical protein